MAWVATIPCFSLIDGSWSSRDAWRYLRAWLNGWPDSRAKTLLTKVNQRAIKLIYQTHRNSFNRLINQFHGPYFHHQPPPIRNLLLMAVVFIGLNPWAGNFPSESWDLEFCPNFALFSFNPNTFHWHFNCVLKALSICSFSYLKAASYKRVRCVPMFPNLNWEFKRFHQFSSVLTKSSHERRPVPPQ